MQLVVRATSEARASTQLAARSRRRVRWSTVGLGAVVGAAGVLATAQLRNGLLRVEPFFDEMWRIDEIRSGDVLARATVGGTTPVPFGWIYFNKALLLLVGDSLMWLRLAGVVCFAVGLGALVLLLGAWSAPRRDTPRERHLLTGASVATALTLPLLPAFTGLERYFNNYLFEVAYAIVMILCCVQIGRRRWALPAFLATAVLAPLFAISSLVLLPALFASVLWWAWRTARDAMRWVFAGGVATVAVFAGIYFGLYQPITDTSIGLHGFWHDELLSTAGGDVLRVGRTIDEIRAGVISSTFPSTSGLPHALLSLALVGGFVVGVVTFSRRWPWFGALLVSGWIGTLVGGAILDAPVTPVRPAFGFWFLVYVTIVFGCWRFLAWLLEQVPAARWVPEAGFAALVVIMLLALWPPAGSVDHAYARGLLADLDVVAASPSHDNLVLSYHYMSQFYPHDRLINRGPSDRHYVVLGEKLGDDTMYAHVDDLVARYLPQGGTLWCVIPYALGPENSDRACQLHTTFATRLLREQGTQASVVGYRITR